MRHVASRFAETCQKIIPYSTQHHMLSWYSSFDRDKAWSLTCCYKTRFCKTRNGSCICLCIRKRQTPDRSAVKIRILDRTHLYNHFLTHYISKETLWFSASSKGIEMGRVTSSKAFCVVFSMILLHFLILSLLILNQETKHQGKDRNQTRRMLGLPFSSSLSQSLLVDGVVQSESRESVEANLKRAPKSKSNPSHNRWRWKWRTVIDW